nr:uncharacterized protein CI109_002334 [Kwoniella shandongensis]KAA5529441.1 hypothetical protein CI109_002334 [Kwoniella shandongensis]
MDGAMHDEDVLEETTNLESTFYTQGYDSGFAHGELHGLFEGRELGKEKAWELWEEVGYYEGWAGMWVELLEKKVGQGTAGGRRGKEARALSHAQTLLDLIKSFPTTNPTPAPAPTQVASASTITVPSSEPESAQAPPPSSSEGASEVETDLATLISTIRARYRLLCSSLGVRPRLATAVIVEAVPGSGAAGAAGGAEGATEGVVEGIEGPMKGVDTRQLRF